MDMVEKKTKKKVRAQVGNERNRAMFWFWKEKNEERYMIMEMRFLGNGEKDKCGGMVVSGQNGERENEIYYRKCYDSQAKNTMAGSLYDSTREREKIIIIIIVL